MSHIIQFRFNTGYILSVNAAEFEEFFAERDNATLVWTNDILDELISRLEELAESTGVGQVDISVYEYSVDGTINLWHDLREKGVPLRYAVGIVIFHQILYKRPLHAMRHF
jgi:hypothetical protein